MNSRLVDGLQEAGYEVRLANPAAIQQYAGLKYTNADSDARWLAHLLRLGLLPTGYIYPKAERAVRDLFRKRSQLVRQKTANLLSVQNLLTRNTGQALNGTQIKHLTPTTVHEFVALPEHALALQVTVAVMQHLAEQIAQLERAVHARVKLRSAFQSLLTVPGIGQTLALTIMLETGEIRRFPIVGQFASYCRCVGSTKWSNSKRKGQGNTKNGNKYLAWAFVEAAHFAIRYEPQMAPFYHRNRAKTKVVVALKAVALDREQLSRLEAKPTRGWPHESQRVHTLVRATRFMRLCYGQSSGTEVFLGHECARGVDRLCLNPDG